MDIQGLCRLAIGGVWMYQGLVPKLLGPHPDELALALALGVDTETARMMSYAAGVGEMLLGGCVLALRHQRWPLHLTLVLMLVLLAYCIAAAPAVLTAPFNPVALNGCMAALALIALRAQRYRC